MTSRVVLPATLQNRMNIAYSFGARKGTGTGWKCVDEFFTVVAGQLTIVTGWPGSGKSEWVDALCINLVHNGWRALFYSPENWPAELHLAKLEEKWVGKPFGPGRTERMTWPESVDCATELGDRIGLIEPEESDAISVNEILDRAEEFFSTGEDHEKRILVMDPWNEIDHQRPSDIPMYEFIGLMLGRIRRWGRKWNTHVVIVAHPNKQRREEGKLPVPTPDMISDSQMWWNKADNCIAIVRDYADREAPVAIHVQKIKFKHVGRIGIAELNYDRPTGRYFEPHRDSSGRAVIYSMAGGGRVPGSDDE